MPKMTTLSYERWDMGSERWERKIKGGRKFSCHPAFFGDIPQQGTLMGTYRSKEYPRQQRCVPIP
jgi:hypothetical protein